MEPAPYMPMRNVQYVLLSHKKHGKSMKGGSEKPCGSFHHVLLLWGTVVLVIPLNKILNLNHNIIKIRLCQAIKFNVSVAAEIMPFIPAIASFCRLDMFNNLK